jgi:glycosyltransferase involved in cell wall biosynthesis
MNYSDIGLLIPCKDEEGSLQYLKKIIHEIPEGVKIVLVEGGSSDRTWDTCIELQNEYPEIFSACKQTGKGKMDAVLAGASQQHFRHVAIWDADFTVRFEDQFTLLQTYVAHNGKALVTGNRLNMQMSRGAMRIINLFGNIFFGYLLSWITHQRVRDTLCGSKIFPAELLMSPLDIEVQKADPFGDFSLLWEANIRRMEIVSEPVRYKSRFYGSTNIHRFPDALKLIKVLYLILKK